MLHSSTLNILFKYQNKQEHRLLQHDYHIITTWQHENFAKKRKKKKNNNNNNYNLPGVDRHHQLLLRPSAHPSWYSGFTTYRTKYETMEAIIPEQTASHAQAGSNMTKGMLLNVFNMDGTKGGGVWRDVPPSSWHLSLIPIQKVDDI